MNSLNNNVIDMWRSQNSYETMNSAIDIMNSIEHTGMSNIWPRSTSVATSCQAVNFNPSPLLFYFRLG